MLENFLLGIAMIVILYLTVIIVKIGIPMFRFMIRVDDLIEFYENFYKVFLERAPFVVKEGVMKISYGKRIVIEFSSSKEASEKFEELLNETISYYNELGFLAVRDKEFTGKRNRLLNICSEVRTMRWRNEV